MISKNVSFILLVGVLLLNATTVSRINAAEAFDRGLAAIINEEGQPYLGWRLLEDDPADISFNVYRSTANEDAVKINIEPVSRSTNFVDEQASPEAENSWFVRAVTEGEERSPSASVTLPENPIPNIARSIPLQGDYQFNRVGICDLDGDGVFDYVIKQPGSGHGLDPGTIRESPDTFKLEAYNGATGEFMWRYDLGWNMNMGIWWTPFITGDFDGDGKAEVALKMAPYAATREEATIAPGGFVLEGPEYITVLNGMTGEEITHADWVERGDPERWGDDRGNRVNRNQIGMAKLDGERLSILVARGTYTLMYVDAWNLVDGRLEKVWRWFGEDSDPPVRGQGGHGMQIFDFDGDGKDEIGIGSFVLDDDGSVLWANGLGHQDLFYAADIIPERPGLEFAYGYESAQRRNGIQVADARTGEMIWGHPEPTRHIHDWGMLADIDATNPGFEFYGGEQRRNLGQFLYSARDGKLLSTEDMGSISLTPAFWLDGPQKVYHVFSYRGNETVLRQYQEEEPVAVLEGRIVAVADVLGDWREELILTRGGELRIASTTVPATTKHVNLMQDPLYRNNVSQASNGYIYPPNTSYNLFPDAFEE